MLYSPRNTSGRNVNEVNSAIAFLIYISVSLYGAKIYTIAESIAILVFLVIFLAHIYMKYPDKNTFANINNLIHTVKEAPISLKINGKKAVNGL